MQLDEKLARAMEPEAWAEYDAGNGVCTNQAGWACLDSLEHAKRVITFMMKEGYIHEARN